MQNSSISLINDQVDGIAEGDRIFKIYETVIDDYINWSSHPKGDRFSLANLNTFSYEGISLDLSEFERTWKELHQDEFSGGTESVNALYLKAINLLQAAITQLTYNSRLVVQNQMWQEQVVEAVYFKLPVDSAFVSEIYAMSVLMSKSSSSEGSDPLQKAIDQFRSHIVESKSILESAYEAVEKNSQFDQTIFSNARQELLDIYRWDARFVDEVENNIKLGSGEGSIEAKLSAQRVIQNIRGTRKGAQNLLIDLLKKEQSQYVFGKTLFIFSLLVLVGILMLLLSFRLYSGHFLQICKYIQGVSRGDFSRPLYISSKEEIGKLSQSLQAMGGSIRHFVNKIQKLSEGLIQSTSTIATTSYEQARVVNVQQEGHQSLENSSREVALLTRSLANEMDVFSGQAKKRLLEDMTEDMLTKLYDKMTGIAESSTQILETFEKSYAKVLRTGALAGLMNNVSEQASLLSLNADIESLQIGKNRGGFGSVIDKIRNFSHDASSSSSQIKSIVDEMSQSISKGKAIAERCLNDISNGAGRLMVAKLQIGRIISQDDIQTGNLLVINEMLAKQADLSEEVIKSISSLGSSIQDNAATLYKLYATVAELRKAAIELEGVVIGLFDRNPMIDPVGDEL